MKFKKLAKGRALYVTPDVIWIAQGMTFYGITYDGKRCTPKYKIGSTIERLIGTFRLSRQALRVGIHHLLPLSKGNLLVTAKRRTYILDNDGKIVNIFQGYQGNKPGHQGVCLSPNGSIFFGEYLLNTDRSKSVNLYRSTDNGNSFQIIKTFPAGDVRHIHFIKWDPYEKCLWLGTGDYGENNLENRLYRSTDNGDSWKLIGSGSQDWRAIGVCFTPTHLVWGTDAGSCSDTVHLVRMSRETHQLEVLEDFEGPCHGCASFADGRVFFSTGVEGGENEKDNKSRMKIFDGEKTTNLLELSKDLWPLIVQYGVMRFPLGTDQCNHVVFTTMALANAHGECVMIIDSQS